MNHRVPPLGEDPFTPRNEIAPKTSLTPAEKIITWVANSDLKVNQCWVTMRESGDWLLQLRHITLEEEVEDIAQLMAQLQTVVIVPLVDDEILWNRQTSRAFTVKEGYQWWRQDSQRELLRAVNGGCGSDYGPSIMGPSHRTVRCDRPAIERPTSLPHPPFAAIWTPSVGGRR
ncbi:hypothetical protein QJS10_CPB18g00304 [Acorus calamus]|uniref:Uncharacterized protein n=1 Tax=Acorus calamus TaxID=4465 RepID=A0AAV9CPH1_ACOCL|nr:hypothetical protein QJS10_CPB18g00304 [Acorus calamus]